GLTLTGSLTGLASAGSTAAITSTSAGKLTLPAAAIITVADSQSQSGLALNVVLAGAATSVTKAGAGTLTLNPPASSTFAGTTIINEGTLILAATTPGVVAIPTG